MSSSTPTRATGAAMAGKPAAADLEVSRPAGRCHVTGEIIEQGQPFYSVLLETVQGIERRDYSEAAWTGAPAEALCYYRTRMPRREEKQRIFVGGEALTSFFLALAERPESIKQRFRFVLGLILLRKRLLKYERTLRDGDTEVWEMRLMRDKSLHRVRNPIMSDEEIKEVTGELGVILAAGGAALADDGSTEETAPCGEAGKITN